MAIDKVREYFKTNGIKNEILEFEVSSATVDLAAKAVGCEPCEIAKTLSFDLKGRAILIVTAGDTKIDNQKFKAHFGTKAKMLSPEMVVKLVGHEIGGVCPFGINDGVEVFLDSSLRRFSSVYPACGSSNSAVKMTIAELEKYSNSSGWIEVCKICE